MRSHARIVFVPCFALLVGLCTAQETFLISRDSAQNLANGTSFDTSTSADGRFIAFDSDATNLVSSDVNSQRDVFWRDREFGITRRVSVNSNGAEGNNRSVTPSISATGRFVVFTSFATNLDSADSNGTIDVFEHDTTSATTRLVSAAPNGQSANFGSFDADVSADGGRVVFASAATSLVAGDNNGKWDIYLRNTVSNTTTRVSHGAGGVEPNDHCYRPRISDDGRFICFMSDASNLVAGDVNGVRDVFLYDVQADTTVAPTVNPGFLIGNGPSESPEVNANGDFVVFTTLATNLVANDTNGAWDVIRWRRSNGSFYRASVSSAGVQSAATCVSPSVSSNGGRIAFLSQASNLVVGDTNGLLDAFVHDVGSSTTTRISVQTNGQQSNGAAGPPAISADGGTITFRSDTALEAGDSNGVPDIYGWGARCQGASVYCTAKTNSNGCVPYICSGGTPTLANPDDFYVTAFRVLNLKSGMFFWGYAPIVAPFGGGTRCVAYPVTRTAVQDSGGNASVNDCSGTYSFFFSQPYMQLHGVSSGTHVFGQFWSRDPFLAIPDNVGLTDAIEFLVLP